MTDCDRTDANVAVLLARSAARRGAAPCIVAPDGRVLWTFEGLAEAAARLAGGLVELGLGHGHQILILERDAHRLYPLVIGAIWAGAVATIPPVSVPLPRALRMASAARPQAVAASVPMWALAIGHTGLRDAPVRLTSGRSRFLGTASVSELSRHQPITPRAVSTQTPALLSFTTGSTGPAAAVMRTHGVLRAQHDALTALRRLGDSDRDFAGLPLLVLDNLARGVTTVMAPRGAGSVGYGRAVRNALVRTGATSATGFPHLFESALRGAHRGELDVVRSIYVGGNRVRRGLLVGLRFAAPAAAATVVYGSTQIEPISAIDGDTYLDLLETSESLDGICVGAAIDGVSLRIEPLPGSPGTPAHDSAGQVLVCGARAAGPTDAEGWVDTGDVGRIAADGRLWLLGRMSNVVGTLYPIGVEREVETLPWVRLSALVRPGSGSGARASLAVQPNHWEAGEARVEQLRQLSRLCDERRWPIESFTLVRRMPVSRGAAAKIDFDRLGRLAASQSRRRSASARAP